MIESTDTFTSWIAADGVNKDWGYEFTILLSDDAFLQYKDGVDGEIQETQTNVGFFPSGGYESGYLRYPLVGDALTNTHFVRIVRRLAYKQTADLGSQGSFNAALHERTFDRNVMMIQQLQTDLDRAPKVPLGDIPGEVTSGVEGNLARWGANGNIVDAGFSADTVEGWSTAAEASATSSATSATQASNAQTGAENAQQASELAQAGAEQAYADVLATLAALGAPVVLKGIWDASTGIFPGAGEALAGWSYIVSVSGTVDGVEFSANDRLIATVNNALVDTYEANWFKADYTDAVSSVAGLTGAIPAATLLAALGITADDVEYTPRPGTPAYVRNVGDWMRSVRQLEDFGAIGGSNDSPTWQTAIDEMADVTGGRLEIPSGLHTLGTELELDLTGISALTETGGLDIVGAGPGHTGIAIDHSGAFIDMLGSFGAAHTRIKGMKVFGTGTRTGIGLRGDGIAYASFEDMVFFNLEYGWRFTDLLSSTFLNCMSMWCKYGGNLDGNVNQSPHNALNFNNYRWQNNYEYGLYAARMGLLNIIGGNCEGNGRLGSGVSTDRYGMRLTDPNLSGKMIAANIKEVWFEGNAGIADIFYQNGTTSMRLNINDNMFVRADASLYTEHNLRVDSNNGGNVIVDRRGNVHSGFSPYVANAARPYYKHFESGGGYVKFLGDVLETDSTEISSVVISGEEIASCTFVGTGVPAAALSNNVLSITDNGVGDYTINFKIPHKRATFKTQVTLGAPGFATVFGMTASSVRIRTFGPDGSTLTDFGFISVRCSE